MGFEVTVQQAEAQPSISIREHSSVAALPDLMGQAFGELFGYLGETGAQPAGPPFAIYRSVDEADMDVEIGVPVAQPLADRGRIHASELPAGKEAHTLHVGPYDQVVTAYKALEQWLDEHGQEPAGPPREHYLNGPDEVSGPEEYQTEVVWPIRDR